MSQSRGISSQRPKCANLVPAGTNPYETVGNRRVNNIKIVYCIRWSSLNFNYLLKLVVESQKVNLSRKRTIEKWLNSLIVNMAAWLFWVVNLSSSRIARVKATETYENLYQPETTVRKPGGLQKTFQSLRGLIIIFITISFYGLKIAKLVRLCYFICKYHIGTKTLEWLVGFRGNVHGAEWLTGGVYPGVGTR